MELIGKRKSIAICLANETTYHQEMIDMWTELPQITLCLHSISW